MRGKGERPFCWERYSIYGAKEELTPRQLATKKCPHRVSGGLILDERFYCEHPQAQTQELEEFCEPYQAPST